MRQRGERFAQLYLREPDLGFLFFGGAKFGLEARTVGGIPRGASRRHERDGTAANEHSNDEADQAKKQDVRHGAIVRLPR